MSLSTDIDPNYEFETLAIAYISGLIKSKLVESKTNFETLGIKLNDLKDDVLQKIYANSNGMRKKNPYYAEILDKIADSILNGSVWNKALALVKEYGNNSLTISDINYSPILDSPAIEAKAIDFVSSFIVSKLVENKMTFENTDLKIGDLREDVHRELDKIIYTNKDIASRVLILEKIDYSLQAGPLWNKAVARIKKYGYKINSLEDELQEIEYGTNSNFDAASKLMVDPIGTITEAVLNDIIGSVKIVNGVEQVNDLGLPVYYNDADLTYLISVLQPITNSQSLLQEMKILSQYAEEYKVFYEKLKSDELMAQRWTSFFNKSKAVSSYVQSNLGAETRDMAIKMENMSVFPHIRASLVITSAFKTDYFNNRKLHKDRFPVIRSRFFNGYGYVKESFLRKTPEDDSKIFIKKFLSIKNQDILYRELYSFFAEHGMTFNVFGEDQLKLRFDIAKIAAESGDTRSLSRIVTDLAKVYKELSHFFRYGVDNGISTSLMQVFSSSARYSRNVNPMFRSVKGENQYGVNERTTVTDFFNRLENYVNGIDDGFSEQILFLYSLKNVDGTPLLAGLPMFRTGDSIVTANKQGVKLNNLSSI